MATDLLTETEILVLDHLMENADHQPRMSDVANSTGLTYSHLSKIINQLETKDGYVSRSINPSDRRQILLTISKAGRSILEKAMEEERERMRIIIPKLTDNEKGVVAESITLFNKILDDIHDKEGRP
jgi:DNA-binding MarR family transcriptional regulator